MVELHVPIILRIYGCHMCEPPKFLIAKRSSTRELFPDKWEFGAAKPTAIETFVDAIRREYKEDFNIDNIIFDIDNLGYPQPVAIYEGKRDHKDSGEILYKGIIFSGKIMDDINKITITNKHSEYKLLTFNEISELIDPSDCVPGFFEHLKVVHNMLYVFSCCNEIMNNSNH